MVRTSALRTKESESDFISWLVDYAHLKHWKVAHFRPARVIVKGVETWRTPVSADGKDFPDFVLARKGSKPIFIETKREDGKPTQGQLEWLEATGGHLFRPSDRDEIMKLLD